MTENDAFGMSIYNMIVLLVAFCDVLKTENKSAVFSNFKVCSE